MGPVLLVLLAVVTWLIAGILAAVAVDWLRPRTPGRRLAVGGLLWPLTLLVLAARALQVEGQLARDVLGLKQRRSRKAKQQVEDVAAASVGFRSPKVGK